MLDILATVERWLREDNQVALATVVNTWGSSPRQPGAKLAVTPEMAMIGSVSGGCVEAAVIEEALDAMKDGKARLLHFGVSDDTAWSVGLACGGMIDVLVEPLDAGWWTHAVELTKAQQSFVTVTMIDTLKGAKVMVGDDGHVLFGSPNLPDALSAAMAQIAHDADRSHRDQIVLDQSYDVFIDIYKPQPRLFIIGGAHVAMVLAKYAQILGWYVTLIDPREVFAAQERFPDVNEIYREYPDKVLSQFGLDSNSYVAILTHDPKIDDPALRVVLPSEVAYVGILSSRRSHEQRVERLLKAGMNPALLEGIHVPVGISIGAKTPEEIALCIMAEITAVRNGVQPRREVVVAP